VTTPRHRSPSLVDRIALGLALLALAAGFVAAGIGILRLIGAL
jgi:hypothetical protein